MIHALKPNLSGAVEVSDRGNGSVLGVDSHCLLLSVIGVGDIGDGERATINLDGARHIGVPAFPSQLDHSLSPIKEICIVFCIEGVHVVLQGEGKSILKSEGVVTNVA